MTKGGHCWWRIRRIVRRKVFRQTSGPSRRRRGDANQSREFHFVHARLQGLDPGEIAFRDFAFRLNKSRNDKKVPDPVGSAVFVLQKLLVSQFPLHHFSEAAAFTRWQPLR